MLSGRYCSLSWNVVGTLLCALVWRRKCFTSLMVSMTHMKPGRTFRDILRYGPTQGMRAWNISHTHKLQESINGLLVVKVGDVLSSFPGGFWNAVIRSEKRGFPRIPTTNQYIAEIQDLRYSTLPRLKLFCSCSGDGGVFLWCAAHRWGSLFGFSWARPGERGWHMWICLDVLWNLGGIITLYLL